MKIASFFIQKGIENRQIFHTKTDKLLKTVLKHSKKCPLYGSV